MTEKVLAPNELLNAQDLAHLTDTQVRIPVVGVSVGLDFLVGLIPVVGDFVMLFVSFRIVYLAQKIGVPSNIRSRMIRNCFLDFVLGLIPFVGDFVDLFYKSNQKNVRLMEKWWVSKNQKMIKANAENVLKQWQDSSIQS